MKKLVLTLFLFTSIIAIGQNNSIDKPPKKTWKILIKNSNNKEVNFNLVGQTIIENDFSIEKKDKDFFTLETTPKTTDKEINTYYFKFVAKDNLIILTGMAKSTFDNSFFKIVNKGMKGSILKEQFNAMFDFAKLFHNSQLEFITE